jgi:hypothetical protein
MGKQTDAHVKAVKDEFGKLQAALNHMLACKKNFEQTFGDMIAAYDRRQDTSRYGNSLKTQAELFDSAVGNSKHALAAAQQAVTGFDTFLTQKAKTINPLKKTALEKYRKWLDKGQADLTLTASKLGNEPSLKHVYDEGKGPYYK